MPAVHQKMKLSPYWWANLYVLAGICAAAEVGLLWLHLRWEISSGEFPLIPVLFMPGVVLMFLISALTPWRFLMTMRIQDGVFRSYLFGRLTCEVFTDRPVYYAIVEFDEHFSITKPYIGVSNHPFRVKPRDPAFFPLKSDRFIDYYDRRNVILFPYDEKTADLFPVERWHRVNANPLLYHS